LANIYCGITLYSTLGPQTTFLLKCTKSTSTSSNKWWWRIYCSWVQNWL